MSLSAVREVLHLHQIRALGDSNEIETSVRPRKVLKAERTDAGSVQTQDFDLGVRNRPARGLVDEPAGEAIVDLGVELYDAKKKDCGKTDAKKRQGG
jgi:hypothetical protein